MSFEKKRSIFLRWITFSFVFIFMLSVAAFYMAPPGFAQVNSTTGVELVKSSFSLAPANPEFMEYLQNLKMGKVQQAGEQPLGYIPSPLNLSHMKGKTVLRQVGSFPATYDLRTLGKLSPVKDQGACGSCWSFATYASLESSLLPSETWDFSENNLKNTHGFDWGHSDGGNRTISAAYLARWSGPISESDDPYNPNSGVSPQGLSPKKHAQNIYFIPDRSGSLDNSNIKQAVMDYGALYTTFYWNSSYYNASNCAYYCGYESSGNHAVAIVGWDDNFDKNKFNTPAPGNGAFIIKNSWGTGWGQSGYFYLSYYDSNAGIENAAFNNAEPVTNYSKIYQYDPFGWIDSIGASGGSNNTCFGANIFTASTGAPLTAASIYTASPNSTYELKVYKDVNDSSGPATGTLAGSKTGIIAKPGYNTVKLDTPIPLTSGQKFSIVIKLTTPGYYYPLPVEYAWSGFDSNATSNPKESWVSLDGSSWSDLYDLDFGNVCIKAFTGTVASNTTIGFDPAEITVAKEPNDPYSSEFVVGVKISDLLSGQKILSMHDIVSFDPEKLEVVKVEVASPSYLDPVLFSDSTIDNTNGIIDFSLARSSSASPGSGGVVYKITMKAKDKGTTALKHSTVELRDENNNSIEINTSECKVVVNENALTVIKPNGEETLVTGSLQTISWTYSGDPGTAIKIELLKDGALNSTITSNTPTGSNGSGSYSWKIPDSQTIGNDYKVRVTSTTNSSFTDTSDNNFNIVTPKGTIGFDPTEISVYKSPNDPYSSEFIVGVKISDLFSGQEILGLHDIVSFDPEMLEVVKVELASPSYLDPVLFSDATIDNTNGFLDFSLARSSSSCPGSGGVVCKITMKAKDKGTTLLKHATVELRDENNQNLPVSTTDGTVNINSLIGDFTGDGMIDFHDLSVFALCWRHKAGDNGWDQKLDNVPGSPFKQADIGPSTGTPPNLIISADGKVDFNDLTAFALMWNWIRD